MELDLLGMTKQTPMEMTTSSKPSFKKFLDRRRSFRDIQGAISKIDPEIIKSVIASGNQFDSPSRFISLPSSPKDDQPQFSVQPVHFPSASSDAEKFTNSAPMTIFYNGTVHVFDLSREKAESIMKFAKEGSSTQPNYSNLSKPEQKFVMNVNGDLPITRTKSLQRFFEKRKERLTSVSLYSFSVLKRVS